MIQSKSALAKATDWLARRDYSSALLRKKLLTARYDDAEVDDAIAKLQRYGYLDDEANCRQQFDELWVQQKLSLRRIICKLIQRGFDRNYIDSLIPDDVAAREVSVASQLLAKRFGGIDWADREICAKAWRFLMARGFDYGTIAAVLAEGDDCG